MALAKNNGTWLTATLTLDERILETGNVKSQRPSADAACRPHHWVVAFDRLDWGRYQMYSRAEKHLVMSSGVVPNGGAGDQSGKEVKKCVL